VARVLLHRSDRVRGSQGLSFRTVVR
jgi:hypothetical protein